MRRKSTMSRGLDGAPENELNAWEAFGQWQELAVALSATGTNGAIVWAWLAPKVFMQIDQARLSA